MTVLRTARRRATAIVRSLVRPIRTVARLLGAWRERHAAERELSRLSDRLLSDIGADGPRLREIARMQDLGFPSRNLAAAEVAQGTPAWQSTPGSGQPWAISKHDREGRSKDCDFSFPPARALPAPKGSGGRQPAGAPIRLVPRDGFRA